MPRLGPSSHFTKEVNLNLIDVDPFTDAQGMTHKLLDIAQTEPLDVCVTQGSSPEAPVRIPGAFMMILMAVQTRVVNLPGSGPGPITATIVFLIMGLQGPPQPQSMYPKIRSWEHGTSGGFRVHST